MPASDRIAAEVVKHGKRTGSASDDGEEDS